MKKWFFISLQPVKFWLGYIPQGWDSRGEQLIERLLWMVQQQWGDVRSNRRKPEFWEARVQRLLWFGSRVSHRSLPRQRWTFGRWWIRGAVLFSAFTTDELVADCAECWEEGLAGRGGSLEAGPWWAPLPSQLLPISLFPGCHGMSNALMPILPSPCFHMETANHRLILLLCELC